MTNISPMRWAIGGVMMMIGIVWFSLGAGLVQGSVLTGQTIWAVIGGILTIAGLWILTRKPKKTESTEAPIEGDSEVPSD